jgi:putative nucleotidyltransferase with HDIG domain
MKPEMLYRSWTIMLTITCLMTGGYQVTYHDFPHFGYMFGALLAATLLSYWLQRNLPNWGRPILFVTTFLITSAMYGLVHETAMLTMLLFFPPLYSLLFSDKRYFYWSVWLTAASYFLIARDNTLHVHLIFLIVFFIYSLLLSYVARQASESAKFQERIDVFSKAIEARDSYTQGHSRRVSRYAVEIGRQVPEIDIEELKVSGDLHDIGKISTPDSVLLKPGRLTAEEYDIIKQHTVDGANLIRQFGIEGAILDGVLYHHERMDGSGYPAGLKGEDIPLVARILAIADTFDAMTTTRSYRVAFPTQKAYDEIVSLAGKFYDPELVEIFQNVYPQFLVIFEAEERMRERQADSNTPPAV